MFEDDESVDLPAGHIKDAEEVESTLAPIPANARSRALTTQHKLDQLEKQRELLAKKKLQNRASSGVMMKSDPAGNSGIKTLVDSDDDDDDDDESDDDVAPVQAFQATDRGATISGLKSKPSMSNAEKKLASLGLSSEVSNAPPLSKASLSSDDDEELEPEEEASPVLPKKPARARSGGSGPSTPSGSFKNKAPSGPAKSKPPSRPGSMGSRPGSRPGSFRGHGLGHWNVDHSEREAASPKANKPKAAEAAAASKGPAKDKEKDDDDDDDSEDDGAAGSSLDQGQMVQLGSNIKEFVMTTIPKSQMQPIQCYIKRVRTGLQKLWPYYVLYSQDPDKFLLSGRRRKKNKQSTYLISTDEKDLSRKSEAYTGKVKSNFVGTVFTMYDQGGNPSRLADGQEVRTELGIVQYDRNVLGTNGPRKMQVFLPKTDKKGQREELKPTRVEDTMASRVSKDSNFIKLMNKTPRWNESLGAFCLNFQGRVTVASVKNFQLVDERDQDRIVLQFGKCDDDTFTMDYSYPLCALQAFAICLTSFDHKLACE